MKSVMVTKVKIWVRWARGTGGRRTEYAKPGAMAYFSATSFGLALSLTHCPDVDTFLSLSLV